MSCVIFFFLKNLCGVSSNKFIYRNDTFTHFIVCVGFDVHFSHFNTHLSVEILENTQPGTMRDVQQAVGSRHPV